MDASNFRGALLRGWRLLVLCGLVAAVIALLIPSGGSGGGGAAKYQATAEVQPLGGKGGLLAIVYVATRPVVMEAAAAQAHVPGTDGQLTYVFSVATNGLTGKKSNAKAVGLSATLDSKAWAVRASNAYATAVGNYLNTQAQGLYQISLCQAQDQISSLESQLATIDQNIATEQSSPGSVDVSNTAPTTTTTTPGDNPCANGDDSGASSDSCTTGASTSAVLTATAPAPTGSTTPTTVAGGAPAKSGPDPVLTLLQGQEKVVTNELDGALGHQAALVTGGTPTAGVDVISPASPYTATLLGAANNVGVLHHRSAKLLIGFAVGLLLAAGIIVMVELFDRSLRSTVRAEYAFDYPVVAEIPAWAPAVPGQGNPAPRLDIVAAPASAVADAYRGLRTAVALAPLASELVYANGNGNGYANGNGNGYANGNGNGNGHKNGNGNGHKNGTPTYGRGNGNGNGNGNGESGHHGGASRQVILVVSPDAQMSRAGVVANLAAAFAETGCEVLVVSNGELGWSRPAMPPVLPVVSGQHVEPDDIGPRARPSRVEGVQRLTLDQMMSTRGQMMTSGPAILDAARQVADIVIVDGAPLLSSHDALALLPAVDVVLVVAEYAATTSDQAARASDLLHRFGAPVLGIVLTNVPGKEAVVPAVSYQLPPPPAPVRA